VPRPFDLHAAHPVSFCCSVTVCQLLLFGSSAATVPLRDIGSTLNLSLGAVPYTCSSKRSPFLAMPGS
jgi:hypothetical protein